jgi:hypothetical protein
MPFKLPEPNSLGRFDWWNAMLRRTHNADILTAIFELAVSVMRRSKASVTWERHNNYY